MSKLWISGGRRLEGEITVQGAKNSVLPLLAASILAGDEVVLENCPDLADVDSAIDILRLLGAEVTRDKDRIHINPCNAAQSEVPPAYMRRMRSSVIFLGAVLARTGSACMSFPGGCELGPRPIDMHLEALRTLGAQIVEEERNVIRCAGQLKGARVRLRFPSVGATENVMLASCTCDGETIIENAAREPEIEDLAGFLNAIGCRVRGAGSPVILIEGVKKTHGARYRVIADRIVAGTYCCAAAATGGMVTLDGVEPSHLAHLTQALEAAGCSIAVDADRLHLQMKQRLRAVAPVVTAPYPGFATDLQAPLMAAMTVAQGQTRFIETIFENRFQHADGLRAMGADIVTDGRTAWVNGVEALHGADTTATDLRGGASLVIAALAAHGESSIGALEHLDRGYAHLEQQLRALGAACERT